ncbi:tetratricopeptide repeat protein [Litorimonas sp. RW-G-Af-16]|uniref:tetratricopeptide repeat protein n=1 Tax=Litorimonas sp. RW-G-Af-16 TaxID=3241168 RepID=UPI00390C56D1
MSYRFIIATSCIVLFGASAAFAQDLPAPTPLPVPVPEIEIPTTPPNPQTDDTTDALDNKNIVDQPDYSQLSAAAERQARLDDMFDRLKAAPNADDANLIAEEIWAVWLDSGSASVNLVLRRGSDAQKKGKSKLARRMYDQVITLEPNYAEGWARSARLALEEKNYSRSLVEATRALVEEPRHFYALWTMGNVFEQLGRQEDALEAYREANSLYPELKAVKERLEILEAEIEGSAL